MAQICIEEIQLLKDEEASTGLMLEEGISTITFYRGDFSIAVKALHAQFTRVVTSNPWLAGRLVKSKAGVRLRHPKHPSPELVDSMFVAISSEESTVFRLTPTSQYDEICTNMYASKKIIVGSGNSILGKDRPVAILTISESAPNEFALIFSLSHAIGDGHTYYDLFQMLQPGANVRELISTRVQSFSESMRDTCGRKEFEWSNSASAICMYTCAMLPAMLGCKPKARCYAFHLDTDRVAEAKAAAVAAAGGEVPYVTTNDILASGFFNECGARIGMMGMDCRGRLEGIHSDLAGNYVTALTMDSEAFATPASVRKMLSSKPYVTTGKPLPSFCKWIWGKESARFAMTTNWSSLAGKLVSLEGCEMVIHLPVQNPANCIYDLMIPFASGVGKTGVICWTVSSDEEGLRMALPVGERVSKDLFP